jgi:hypothetical protein
MSYNSELAKTQATRRSPEEYLLILPGDQITESDVLKWAEAKHSGAIICDKREYAGGPDSFYMCGGPDSFDMPGIRTLFVFTGHLIICPEPGCPALGSWRRRVEAGERTTLIATSWEHCHAWAWEAVRHSCGAKLSGWVL